MDRKSLLALLPEDKREAASTFLDDYRDEARKAGHDSAGFDFRKSEKATKAATKERDALQARLAELEGFANDADASRKAVSDLEAQLSALTAERDSMAPIVREHKAGILRTAVTKAANLRDDLYADALIARMGLELSEENALSEDHLAQLTAWAEDPANRERVQVQTSYRPTAKPASHSEPVTDSVAAYMKGLPESKRALIQS